MDRTKSIFETVLSLPDNHKDNGVKRHHQQSLTQNPASSKDEKEDEEEDEDEEDFDELEDWLEWFFSKKHSSRHQTQQPKPFSLQFEAVGSGISDPAIYQARVEREKKSLQTFNQQLKEKWQKMEDLHQWLFTEHDAYASQRLQKARSRIDQAVLKTY